MIKYHIELKHGVKKDVMIRLKIGFVLEELKDVRKNISTVTTINIRVLDKNEAKNLATSGQVFYN